MNRDMHYDRQVMPIKPRCTQLEHGPLVIEREIPEESSPVAVD
jgi:hypothetical protein